MDLLVMAQLKAILKVLWAVFSANKDKSDG